MSQTILKHGNMSMNYSGAEGEELRMASFATQSLCIGEPNGGVPNFTLALAGDSTASM